MTDTMETTQAAPETKTPGELLQSAIRDHMWAQNSVKLAEEALASAKETLAEKYGEVWSAWGAAGKPVGTFTMYAMSGSKVVRLYEATHGAVGMTIEEELKL